MSYTIKVEKTLMRIPLAKALPRQQQCARERSLQIHSLPERGEDGEPPGAEGPVGATGTPSSSWLSSGRAVTGLDAKFKGAPKFLVIEIS